MQNRFQIKDSIDEKTSLPIVCVLDKLTGDEYTVTKPEVRERRNPVSAEEINNVINNIKKIHREKIINQLGL